MDEQSLKYYVCEINCLLKDYTRQAKIEADHSKEDYKSHAEGVLMGYYSIITLLKHEAFAFCMDQKELGLADIKPDVDLLGLHRNPDIDFVEDNWSIDVMNEEKVKGYLSDTIMLLKEQAREAKKEADHPKEGFEEYTKGELMAYCTVFSLLKNQASIFNIDQKEIGLADIEPERDLLYTQMNSKVGNLSRKRSEFKPALAMPKQLNLNKLSDGGRFEFSSC